MVESMKIMKFLKTQNSELDKQIKTLLFINNISYLSKFYTIDKLDNNE